MTDDGLRILTELKDESNRKNIPNDGFAVIHLGLGNKQEELDYLEKHIMARAETANAFGVGRSSTNCGPNRDSKKC